MFPSAGSDSREALAVRAESLAAEVAAAIEEHAIVQHPKHGRVYAYEVDGCTSFSLSRSPSRVFDPRI